MLFYGFMSARNIVVVGYIWFIYVSEKFHPVIKHLFHNIYMNIYSEFSSLSHLYNHNYFSNISKWNNAYDMNFLFY